MQTKPVAHFSPSRDQLLSSFRFHNTEGRYAQTLFVPLKNVASNMFAGVFRTLTNKQAPTVREHFIIAPLANDWQLPTGQPSPPIPFRNTFSSEPSDSHSRRWPCKKSAAQVRIYSFVAADKIDFSPAISLASWLNSPYSPLDHCLQHSAPAARWCAPARHA